MDEKDLKNQALLERIAELTAQYEDKIADLRVALTVQAQQLEDAKKEADDDVEVATEVHPGVPAPNAKN
jgi:hypothetical protein